MSATKRIIPSLFASLLLFPGTAWAEPMPGSVGTVVEKVDSGGYTCVQIALDGESAWYAAPGTLTPDLDFGDMATNTTSCFRMPRWMPICFFAGKEKNAATVMPTATALSISGLCR